jgi:hypothetical protein
MKFLFTILFLLLLASCSEKHLNEKTFRNGDITVKWYNISTITTMHDYVDIEHSGHTETIMEANTGGIYDILIKGDTITIQVMSDLVVYNLAAKALGYNTKLDTSITLCMYTQKYVPKNAKYYCDEILPGSTKIKRGK